MTNQRFDDLTHLTSLVFAQAKQRHSGILAEENKLRQMLRDLSDQESQAINVTSDVQFQKIGADVAWSKWIDQTRLALNISLAKTLARKESSRQALQASFGKNEVAKTLEQTARQKRMKMRESSQLQRIQSLMTYAVHDR